MNALYSGRCTLSHSSLHKYQLRINSGIQAERCRVPRQPPSLPVHAPNTHTAHGRETGNTHLRLCLRSGLPSSSWRQQTRPRHASAAQTSPSQSRHLPPLVDKDGDSRIIQTLGLRCYFYELSSFFSRSCQDRATEDPRNS